MGKTLTIMLLSGAAENEDAVFAVRLAQAALTKGHKVNMYLFGNAVNLAKREVPIEGDLHIAPRLLEHIEPTKVSALLGELAAKGADISTCHTNEHARGIESQPYVDGVKWGDVGGSLTRYMMTSDLLLGIGH